MDVDPIPAKVSVLPISLIVGCLRIFEFSGTVHLFTPTSPKDLKAVFTENIFGTDGVRLTWAVSSYYYD